MSDDAPVTSKDFQKLIKAVQSTNKKLDAQAEASLLAAAPAFPGGKKALAGVQFIRSQG